MAGVRISALPVLPSAQATDLYATVQSGTTYQGTLTQLATFFDSNLTYVPLAGGTMTGPLILSGDPTMALGAVTKQYADNIAAGLNPIEGVLAASTTALTVTYNNGTAGVGATLTNATTQAAFVIDGYTASVGDRILIKDQASTFQNGIYTVTDVGSISTNWVLTRPSDFDSSTNIQKGDLVSVINGTVNMGSSWYQTQTVTTVGTDAILFSVFFSPASYIPVALTSAHILVGNASNKAASVAMTGAVSISNTGVTSLNLTAPQVTVYTTGSGNYSVPSGALYLEVHLIGGGGGGGGSGTASQTTGTTGGDTTFSTLTGSGGVGGVGTGGGGAGGAAAGGDLNLAGSKGGSGGTTGLTAGVSGGIGGQGYVGGGGDGGNGNIGTQAGIANKGAGGGGATGGTTFNSAGGGGGGGYVEKIFTGVSGTLAYSVGAGGGGGSAGTSGQAGATGSAGHIKITAYFQ